jgi:hypothetical protein
MKESPQIELVLSRLFDRYFGAGGPKETIYGNPTADPAEKQPLEQIAMELIQLNQTMDRIADSLEKIADKE